MPENDEAAGLRELALRLRPRAQALADQVLTVYQAEIPQYAQVDDPHVLADMAAVSLAGLSCWLDVLEHERPVDGDSLRPVLDAIRRRALRGVGMDAMMRAFRIAARVVWQEILELPVDSALVAPFSTRMLEFTDRLATAAELAYADEALSGPREPDPTGSAIFEAILSDRDAGQFHHANWLAAPHCVVIVEAVGASAPGAPDTLASPVSPADLAAALVRETRAAYWTTRLSGVVAACLVEGADGRDVLVRHLARFTNASRPLSVAVGGVAQGPSGTRMSYHEALEAMRVGERLSRGAGRIHDSQELAPLVSLVSEPERARRFAEGCLYPLGRLTERSWVLPTLAAYLKCQASVKEIAVELAVHPSTVKYRLNELRPFLDAHVANGDQAAALLLAVRVSEYFAEAESRD
jgi:hypothetical protein